MILDLMVMIFDLLFEIHNVVLVLHMYVHNLDQNQGQLLFVHNHHLVDSNP